MKKKTVRKPVQKKKKTAKKAAARKAVTKKTPAKKPARILSPGEPPPFRIENSQGRGVGLVICDHASNRVPRSLKDLGLKKTDLKKHIGWDIGAEDASLHLGRSLDMPVVLANYSRLLLDLNRAPHHAECIAEVSDHVKIPANTGLSRGDREQRLKEIMDIPVFHDDQHGTAIVAAAALLNALHLVDKPIETVKLVCSGAGAAAATISGERSYLAPYGVISPPQRLAIQSMKSITLDQREAASFSLSSLSYRCCS